MSFSPMKKIKSRYATSNISTSTTGTIYNPPTMTVLPGGGQTISITPLTHDYYILGNKVVGDSFDTLLSMIIASVNLNGIEYYVELKKQGVNIHDEKVKDFLEYQLKSYERNKKIEEIIK